MTAIYLRRNEMKGNPPSACINTQRPVTSSRYYINIFQRDPFLPPLSFRSAASLFLPGAAEPWCRLIKLRWGLPDVCVCVCLSQCWAVGKCNLAASIESVKELLYVISALRGMERRLRRIKGYSVQMRWPLFIILREILQQLHYNNFFCYI